MPSTSVKHQDFIAEPMGEKDVDTLAGVGAAYAAKMKSKGFDKAYIVLGQFLVLKKDEELFVDWLKDEFGMNSHHASSCYNCLKEWCEQHL